MTQARLASAASVSLSTVRKLEQGSRGPGDQVLAAVANALGVTPERLSGALERTDSRVHDAIPAIRDAIVTHDLPEDGPIRPLPQLRAAVNVTVGQRLSAQYGRLALELPRLITELSRAACSARGHDAEHARALLVMAFRAADGVAFKYNYNDLSNHIIRLMMWESEHVGDDLLSASVAYVRTEMFFASQNLNAGLRQLELSLNALASPVTTAEMATRGALHMRAAIVAGRISDATTAIAHMGEARRLADAVPEGIYRGTAFGPSSVYVHELSLAVELGDGAAALAVAHRNAPPQDLPSERRSHYYLSLALAQLWEGFRDDAFDSLQVARRIAPQHVREHPQVRETLGTLLRLHRSPPDNLVSYANWAQVV
jgi:transcriptional regulator with XRE-family HTH domain